MGIFTRTAGYLKDKLGKTRDKITGSLSAILSLGRKIDENLLDELEETLISDDIGVETTMKLVSELREAYRNKQIATTDDIVPFLKEQGVSAIFGPGSSIKNIVDFIRANVRR